LGTTASADASAATSASSSRWSRPLSLPGRRLPGLLYLAPDAEDLHAHLNTAEVAFNTLGEKELCPGAGMLEKINAGLR